MPQLITMILEDKGVKRWITAWSLRHTLLHIFVPRLCMYRKNSSNVDSPIYHGMSYTMSYMKDSIRCGIGWLMGMKFLLSLIPIHLYSPVIACPARLYPICIRSEAGLAGRTHGRLTGQSSPVRYNSTSQW